MPLGHNLHAVDPLLSAQLPAEQLVHVPEPCELQVPGSQDPHASIIDAPTRGFDLPAVQRLQASVAPIVSLQRPIAHGEHVSLDAAPSTALQRPAVQFMHAASSDAPLVELHFPLAHIMHEPKPSPDQRPAEQSLQVWLPGSLD